MPATQAAFFFGAGISRPSGGPLVGEIAESAFGREWHFTTEKVFESGANPNPAFVDDVTPRVKAFLSKVDELATGYLTAVSRSASPRKPNYEDLFSLCEQASRAELDHVPNLAVVEFRNRLRKETESLHRGFTVGSGSSSGLPGLAETSCDFLHWVVHDRLHSGVTVRAGLQAISRTAAAVDALDIFTLNHDLLVEEELRAVGFFDLETGFDNRDHGECSVYSGWPRDVRTRIRLFKLHGSLNWYFFEFPNWGHRRQYAIPDGDWRHCHDERGDLLLPMDWKAAFLSGTIVKEQRYGLGFWGDILSHFRHHLSRHSRLICCGYSFGDPGINLRLIQWLHDRIENQLVILTPDHRDKFLADKPAWLSSAEAGGKINWLPNYLETVPDADLERYFDPLV